MFIVKEALTLFTQNYYFCPCMLACIGRFDDSVIEERRQCSEDLLQFSANIPALYNSQHIQDFFKVPIPLREAEILSYRVAIHIDFELTNYCYTFSFSSREGRSKTVQSSLDQLNPFWISWLTVYLTVVLMVGLLTHMFFFFFLFLYFLKFIIAVILVLLKNVLTSFSVQRDISGAEDLTITSEYGGKVSFWIRLILTLN